MSIQERIKQVIQEMNLATAGSETLAEIERIEAPFRLKLRLLTASR